MKLVLSLNSKKFIYDYVDIGVEYFVVGAKYFSCRQALSLEYDEIANLKKVLGNKKVWVLVNALVEEKYIDFLEKHLIRLSHIGVDGILFQDFGVLQICNEHNFDFEMIYHPDTLNTNQATLNYLGTQGINGAFMAYSKRKLLTNYFKEINQDIPIGISDDLTIQANGVNYSCHIYEDQYGCHILSKQQMCGLDIMSSFQDFDYLYIESLYVDELKLVEIVNLYQDALISVGNRTYGKVAKELISQLYQLDPNIEYHHSFMFDATVYKIDDVRKREENEKCK